MNDLLYLMNRLVDEEGTILIPGMYDDVDPVTSLEEKIYANIDFNIDLYKERLGVKSLKYEDKVAAASVRSHSSINKYLRLNLKINTALQMTKAVDRAVVYKNA